MTTTYLHAGTDPDIEYARLRLLENRYDPDTFRRLEAVGPGTGARCLEVGAGAGSVAQWLAGRVGPTGRVVATDRDLRYLDRLDEPTIEVRRHDILVDAIEDAAFDLVHCRALLLHLPDPGAALRQMARAVRPGGLLLVEDADYVTMVAADPDHALGPRFDQAIADCCVTLRDAGRVDLRFGRRLPGLVAGLGLTGEGTEATVALRHGGDPAATLLRQSLQVSLAAGPDPAAGLTAVEAATRDPSFAFFDAMSVAAWGRRRA